MSREDRQKASDVFRNSTYVFSGKTTFGAAFPQVEHVVVEVEESGRGISASIYGAQETRLRKYTETTLGEFVDCSNSLCYNGGIGIGSMLREAIREHKTEFEGSGMCKGYEGSPRGRRRYRSCLNHFKVRGRVTYKEQNTNTPAAEDPTSGPP